MKYKNKIVSIMLSLVLLISSMNLSYAGEKYDESITVNDLVMKTIVKKKDYEKSLLKNTVTNEIQYIEYYKNKDGLAKYVVLDEAEKVVATIESSEEEVIVKDKYNRVLERIDKSSSFTINAEWGSKRYIQGDKNTDFGNVLIIYGIIAGLLNAPLGIAAILTAASIIQNNSIPNVWYKGWYRTKWEDGLYYKQTYLDLYEVSNFTGYIYSVEYIDFH